MLDLQLFSRNVAGCWVSFGFPQKGLPKRVPQKETHKHTSTNAQPHNHSHNHKQDHKYNTKCNHNQKCKPRVQPKLEPQIQPQPQTPTPTDLIPSRSGSWPRVCESSCIGARCTSGRCSSRCCGSASDFGRGRVVQLTARRSRRLFSSFPCGGLGSSGFGAGFKGKPQGAPEPFWGGALRKDTLVWWLGWVVWWRGFPLTLYKRGSNPTTNPSQLRVP